MRTALVCVLVAMAGCEHKALAPPPPPVTSPAAGMTAKMRRAKVDVEAAQKAEEKRDDSLIEQAK